MKLYYHGKWVARIIEGCNALNVMILFVAFVVAFSGKWKSTLLFIVFGIVVISFVSSFRNE